MSTICAIYMTGVIWMVQLAHYPLMTHIGTIGFKDYQKANLSSTTWVVMPVMIIEVFCAGGQLMALILEDFNSPYLYAHLISLVALVVIWLSTFFLQVPLHQKLLSDKDVEIIRKLVKTNWLRTLAWSLRSSLFIYLFLKLNPQI
jgi:hypothetical protein